MTAHPPRVRWHVETYDDLAAEWSGVPETDRQTAVKALAHRGQDLGAVPDTTPDGRPAVRFIAGSDEIGHAESTVPLEHVEEIVAGVRDIARQAGGQTAPARRRLTAAEQRAQLLGEISVPVENQLRAAGHPAAADLIAGILRDLARTVARAAEMTQDEFALAPGGPGPAATEEAGA